MVRFCQFCNRKLDVRSVKEQDEHEFGCIGKTQSSLLSINLPPESSITLSANSANLHLNSSREKSPEPSPTKLTKKLSDRRKKQASENNEKKASTNRQCHICRKDIRGSLEQRQAHIMKCTNKAKMSDTQTFDLVANERNYTSDEEDVPLEVPKKETKKPTKKKSKTPTRKRPRKSKEPPIPSPYFDLSEPKEDEEGSEIPCSSKEAQKQAKKEITIKKNHFALISSPKRKSGESGDETEYSLETFENPNLVVNNDIFKGFAKIRVFKKSMEQSPEYMKVDDDQENQENFFDEENLANIDEEVFPSENEQSPDLPLPQNSDFPDNQNLEPIIQENNDARLPSPELPPLPDGFSDEDSIPDNPLESNIQDFSIENIDEIEESPIITRTRNRPLPPVRSPLKPHNLTKNETRKTVKKRKSSEVLGNCSKIAKKSHEKTIISSIPSSSLAARPLGGWKSPERKDSRDKDEEDDDPPTTTSSVIQRQMEETQTEFQIRPVEDTILELKEDALRNGDLVKYSKCGKKIRFHSSWIQVRCPQLKRADTRRLAFAELKNLHNAIYSPNDNFSQSQNFTQENNREDEELTLEATPSLPAQEKLIEKNQLTNLPLPSQSHMPKFVTSSQKSNSSNISSTSQIPETQSQDRPETSFMMNGSFTSPIITFDRNTEKSRLAELKYGEVKTRNDSLSPIMISSEDEKQADEKDKLSFLEESGEPSMIIQTNREIRRSLEKPQESFAGLGLDSTEDGKQDEEDEIKKTPPWIQKHPSLSKVRKTPNKPPPIEKVEENNEHEDSFGNSSCHSGTLFDDHSSQELPKESPNPAPSPPSFGGTAPFSVEKYPPSPQAAQSVPDESPVFGEFDPPPVPEYDEFDYNQGFHVEAPDFYSQSQQNCSFHWCSMATSNSENPAPPKRTTRKSPDLLPIILSSDDDGETSMAHPHDLSDPPKLDHSRLSGFNEKISFCQERRGADEDAFDLGLSDILEKNFPNSAPNTPVPKKKKLEKTPEEMPKKQLSKSKPARSLFRKSLSLNSSLAEAPKAPVFIPSPAQKQALEEATAKYQKMPKEDLIKECEKYGMKSKLSKTAMIGKLKEIFIYQKLHQRGPQRGQRVTFPAKEKINRKVVKFMTQDRDQSSDNSVDEESGNQAASAFEEISEEQAELNKMKQVTKMITSLPFLHKRVITYDVIGLRELESHCVDANIQVDEQFLIKYCDKTCITFRQEKRRPVKGNLRAKRSKKR